MSIGLRKTPSVSIVTALLIGIAGTGCGARSSAPQETAASQSGGKLSSFAQEIDTPVKDIKLKAGEKTTIPVTIKNSGQDTWDSKANPPVNASYRWFLDGKDAVVETTRTFLNKPLGPGQSVSLNLPIVAPATPGNYTLRLSMVQEGVAWFINAGGRPTDLPAVIQ